MTTEKKNEKVEEEFKTRTTEELLDPQAYRSALRNVRSRAMEMLHRVRVDLDLLELDQTAAVSPEERDPVLQNLKGQVDSLTNRINEIDRRLALADKNDRAVMEPEGEAQE